jgi:hypothetical protein
VLATTKPACEHAARASFANAHAASAATSIAYALEPPASRLSASSEYTLVLKYCPKRVKTL